MNNYVIHSGVAHDDNPPGRGSGRYAYGSGENPYQHRYDFLSRVQDLKSKGLKDSEIAHMLIGEKATTSDLKARLSVAKNEIKKYNYAKAVEILDKCNGNISETARRMSDTDPTGKKWNESSVRSLLDPTLTSRRDKYQNTADVLKEIIEKNDGTLDISAGTELHMGVTSSTLKVAVSILEEQGYQKKWIPVIQPGTQNKSNITVLCKEGMTFPEVNNLVKEGKLGKVFEYSPDGGTTYQTPEFPTMLDSKRVFVRYGDQGGSEKDGVIEIRRGVEDLSLGGSQYAQVRIGVDGTHFMKGMAMYADDKDFPSKQYDIIYNTNKKTGTPVLGDKDNSVMKLLKTDQNGNVDKDNPFGALIKMPKEVDGVIQAGGQRKYIDQNGKEQLSPVNKLQDEGDWDSWSKNLASQFLSKQPMKLINQQLDLSIKDKKLELEKINKLTNPEIKKKMLEDFSSQCDANAADLSAKGFKNQAFQVLLPIPTLKDTEIYAPRFKNGDTVALIRYPHAGPFEIPILTVNNHHKDAQNVMAGAKDAVGINSHNAERLSGADFDGDTALVIPLKSNNISVKSIKQLTDLEGFDPKALYKLPPDAPRITPQNKQTQMGVVSNLITDMTVGGANYRDIAKAVKHSMVVIDSEKHHLDYKQSEKDNDIRRLKETYQGTETKKAGASTILSRAKSEVHEPERKEITNVKNMTPEQVKAFNEGKRVFVYTDRTKMKLLSDPNKMTSEELERYRQGKKIYRHSDEKTTQKVHAMDLVDDAMELVRDKTNPKELAYAKYANGLKSLANQARKEMRSITAVKVDPVAKKTYAAEVASLNQKLNKAMSNHPKERQAWVLANSYVSDKVKDNPDMDYEHRQRERALALTKARNVVGAKKEPVVITDREWEAIQARAISSAKLNQILRNTDSDAFKKRAMPKENEKGLTSSEIALIKSLASAGDGKMYSNAEIADRLGISVSTVSKYL